MYKRDNSWYSDFWYKGKRYRKSWGEITKTAARDQERKFRLDVKEGRYEKELKRITFKDFAGEYLKEARMRKKPNAARRNESSINMLMPTFKDKLLQEITAKDVKDYMVKRRQQPVEHTTPKSPKRKKLKAAGPGTVNRDISTMKNMFAIAVQWGYLKENVLATVKKLREDSEKIWALTEAEEKRLLEECDKRPQKKKYLKDLVQFALNTGMREQEIFNLRKADIDFASKYIKVSDTKTHKDRNVPMNAIVIEIVKSRMKDMKCEHLFFNHKGKRLTVLTNAFWSAVYKAKLTRVEKVKVIREDREVEEKKNVRFRFHDLRHTFGSRLGMAGVDLKTIMEIMGHETPRVAMRYQHPAPEHKLRAVRTLETPMGGQDPTAVDNVVNLDSARAAS